MAVLGEVRRADPHHRDYAPEPTSSDCCRRCARANASSRFGMTSRSRPRYRKLHDNTATVRAGYAAQRHQDLCSRAEEASALGVTRVNREPGHDGIGCVLVEERHIRPRSVRQIPHPMGGEIPARGAVRGLRAPAEIFSSGKAPKKLLSPSIRSAVSIHISLVLQKVPSTKRCAMRAAFGVRKAIGEFQGALEAADSTPILRRARIAPKSRFGDADPFPDAAAAQPKSIATRSPVASRETDRLSTQAR